jgi:hypothetical protein
MALTVVDLALILPLLERKKEAEAAPNRRKKIRAKFLATTKSKKLLMT